MNKPGTAPQDQPHSSNRSTDDLSSFSTCVRFSTFCYCSSSPSAWRHRCLASVVRSISRFRRSTTTTMRRRNWLWRPSPGYGAVRTVGRRSMALPAWCIEHMEHNRVRAAPDTRPNCIYTMTIRPMRIPRNPRFGAGLSRGRAYYIRQIEPWEFQTSAGGRPGTKSSDCVRRQTATV